MSYNYAAHHHTQPPPDPEFPYWPAQPHSFHSADQPWQQTYQFGMPLWEEPTLHSQPPGPDTQPWQQPPDPPDWQHNPQPQQSASQEQILAAIASLESRWDYTDRRVTEGRQPPAPDLSPPYSGPATWYHGCQPEYHHPQVQNQFAHDTHNARHSGGFQQSHLSSPNFDGQLPDPYYQWDEYQQQPPPYVLPQPHRQYPTPYGCPPAPPQKLQPARTRRPTCWDPPQEQQAPGWETPAPPPDQLDWQKAYQPTYQPPQFDRSLSHSPAPLPAVAQPRSDSTQLPQQSRKFIDSGQPRGLTNITNLFVRSPSPAQLAAVNDYNEKLRVYRLDQAALLARVTAWFEENIDGENLAEENTDNTPTIVLGVDVFNDITDVPNSVVSNGATLDVPNDEPLEEMQLVYVVVTPSSIGAAFTPIDVVKMFNSGGAVKQVGYDSKRAGDVELSLHGCGTFGAYSSLRPKRITRGRVREQVFDPGGFSTLIVASWVPP